MTADNLKTLIAASSLLLAAAAFINSMNVVSEEGSMAIERRFGQNETRITVSESRITANEKRFDQIEDNTAAILAIVKEK